MQEDINQLKKDVADLKGVLQFQNTPIDVRANIQNIVVNRTDDTSATTVLVSLSGLAESTYFAAIPTGFLLVESNGKLYKVAQYGNV
tara:strand:+ start:205 stop:465 length:261 start_codon:yes stop_codon:yes gene_type:complete